MSRAEGGPAGGARVRRAGPCRPRFRGTRRSDAVEALSCLSDGEARSIAQLTDGLGQTRQGVTKHLRVLEGAGIVASRRIGRESRFVFTPQPIREARDYLDRVSGRWDAALGRLRAFVEEGP